MQGAGYGLIPSVVASDWIWDVIFFAPMVIALVILIVAALTRMTEIGCLALAMGIFIGIITFMVGFVATGPGAGGAAIGYGIKWPQGMDSCDVIAYRNHNLMMMRTNRTEYITARAVSDAVGVPVGSVGGEGKEITGDSGRATTDVRYMDGAGHIVKGTLLIDFGKDGPWKTSLYDDGGEPVAYGTGRDMARRGALVSSTAGTDVMDAACSIAGNSTMQAWTLPLARDDYRDKPGTVFRGIAIIKENGDRAPSLFKYTKDGEDAIHEGGILIVDGRAYMVPSTDGSWVGIPGAEEERAE